jgi:DeoR/GlpR family transcriptional regulator of sugar metabolism
VLTEERKASILKALRTDGRVLAPVLSAELNVSEDTIRRDLRDLADQGLLRRVHGGALPAAVPKTTTPINFHKRAAQSPAEKNSIAQAACKLIQSGQTVIFDGGTTALRVAELLPPQINFTAITHSLPVAMILAQRPSIQLVMIGGTVASEYLSTKGAVTVAAYRQVRADVCVLSVASLHLTAGLSVLDYEDAEVKRAMIAGSTQVICVASSQKLGSSAPFVVGPTTAIHDLITDSRADEQMIAAIKELGVRVVQARGD